ncbi:MAG TPA: universal stress protein [Acidimicrobiales bacterium]|nr:universal stress protein [Acidimicrobiales bacterium]
MSTPEPLPDHAGNGDAPSQSALPTTGRVVVGVDGSAAARVALSWAAEVASWRHWTLHLVHAWHINYPAGVYGLDFGLFEKSMQEAAEELVATLEAEVGSAHPALEIRHTVGEGAPARMLVEASKGAELLVVGSRGLGGFSSLALGSVGQSCVHHAHCPVLVVRPRSHDTAA